MLKEEQETVTILICFLKVFYMNECFLFQHYLLYISMQYTNNTAVDNFIHKSCLTTISLD